MNRESRGRRPRLSDKEEKKLPFVRILPPGWDKYMTAALRFPSDHLTICQAFFKVITPLQGSHKPAGGIYGKKARHPNGKCEKTIKIVAVP